MIQREERTGKKGKKGKRTGSVYGIRPLSEYNDTWISVGNLTHARGDS